MAWSALGLTVIVGGLVVWIATQESRLARILGSAAVLSLVLTPILSRNVEQTSIWTSVVGGIVIVAQATVLGILTLWIASRQSCIGRIVGGLVMAVLSIALTYGMIFGPMWKANVLIIATIMFTWILGRQQRDLTRA